MHPALVAALAVASAIRTTHAYADIHNTILSVNTSDYGFHVLGGLYPLGSKGYLTATLTLAPAAILSAALDLRIMNVLQMVCLSAENEHDLSFV